MAESDQPRAGSAALSLAALGVVFGDIGTSPLYAMRECFVGASGFPVDHANVFGILSLITWSLVVVVTLKYVGLVLRADNQGEGGILALAHLVVPDEIDDWSRTHWVLVGIGLFGAALLFGDGIITPALSVLSAVEGLAVATPALEPVVLPLTLAVLVGLFAIQRFGTGRVGSLFGPVMLVWFTVLGGLGLWRVLDHPMVLGGLDPRHAVWFFTNHGLHGTLILGAVFLAVTGAEAMYADLGHFGRAPIQRAWFGLAFPALLLNYFGQGSLLLQHPEVVDEVFYRLAPAWALYPLVGLATLATIIASQAVISGVFSLTAQAVQLQYLPRTPILHTSSAHRGQIYVPVANRFLMVGTVLLVLGFRSSGGLADAYGIAVSLTMVLTTGLLFFVMRDRWAWAAPAAVAVAGLFLAIDLGFFLSIVRKVMSGGWIPLTIAVALMAVMVVWRRGRQLLARHHPRVRPVALPEEPLVVLVRHPDHAPIDPSTRPDALFVHVNQCHRPYMRGMSHGEVHDHGRRRVVHACFGFMEQPDVPELLVTLTGEHGIELAGDPTYVLIHETFRADDDRGMPAWAKRMYRWLEHRAERVARSYQLPPDRVVELNPEVLP